MSPDLDRGEADRREGAERLALMDRAWEDAFEETDYATQDGSGGGMHESEGTQRERSGQAPGEAGEAGAMASRLLESMEDVQREVEHLRTVEGQGGGTAEARYGGAQAGIGGLNQTASSVEDILNEWDDLLSPGPGSGVWTQEQSGASPEQAMALAEGGVATLMGASRRVAGLLGGVDGMGGTDEDDGGDVGRSAGGDDTRRAPQSPGAHPGSDDHLQQVARQHTASHQLPCPSGEVAGRAGTNSEQLSGRRRPGGELSATGRAWDTQATVGMGPQVGTVRRDSYSASVERIAQVRGHLARQSAQGLQSRGVGAGGRGLQAQVGGGCASLDEGNPVYHSQPLGTALGHSGRGVGGQALLRPGCRRQRGDVGCGLGGGGVARLAGVSRLQRHSSSAPAGQPQRGSGGPVRLREQRGGLARGLGGGDMARADRGAGMDRLQAQGGSALVVQMQRGLGGSARLRGSHSSLVSSGESG
ncbi:hypothetical protein CYMTET_49048 [Cymbomonas tetramitiformis]|uniref:Uncharacterized protein n=1 Tax=Cymbomonas tetramitiformis TaxID=36881 RepID=A0AAE0BSM4_9CHLO|nr:hypothetical protein CYMTET_49048 [Cymbomonas tetramitiformis]